MYFYKRSKEETKDAITAVRLCLYHSGLRCGARAIQKEMKERGSIPLPSISTINRVLDERFLTHRRTGFYEGDYHPEVLKMMKLKGIQTSTGLRKLLSEHFEGNNFTYVEMF